MKVCVLGAGLAGLSAGYELSSKNVDVTLLEKTPEVGGIAKSFTRGDFTYDLGPHRFHTKDEDILAHLKDLLNDNLALKERKSKIFLQGRFFKYPLKVGDAILSMPPLITLSILVDYLKIKIINLFSCKPDDSFESWVVNRFGWKLYKIFFREYTEKTWGIPCTSISVDWAAQRISLLSLWDTLLNTVLNKKDKPRTYVSEFYYPQKGGIGIISENYAEVIRDRGGIINLDVAIDKILVEENKINSITYHSNNAKKTEIYDHLFSTIPLTDLINLIQPKPSKDVLEAARKLMFRSIIFVYLVINKQRVFQEHWIYLPERQFTSNRVTEPKNFSSQNAPDGKTLLCFEVTCFDGDEIWSMSNEELRDKVISDLKKLADVKEEEVVDSFTHRIKHAYPLYSLDYSVHLEKIKKYLDEFTNLSYFGRNALFRYNNMDHSIDMGLKAAQRRLGQNVDYQRVATGQKWFG